MAFSGIGRAINRARLRAVGAGDLVGVAGAPRLTEEDTTAELTRVANTLDARILVAERRLRLATIAVEVANETHNACERVVAELYEQLPRAVKSADPVPPTPPPDTLGQKIANIEAALTALKSVHLPSAG